MDKLVISIYEELDYRKESLHITFNVDNRRFGILKYKLSFRNLAKNSYVQKWEGIINGKEYIPAGQRN